MKKKSVTPIGILVIAAAGLMMLQAQAPKQTAAKAKIATTATLPASLDQYYPPKAQQPLFLFSMLGMASPLAGLIADVQENDLENAKANFQLFKTEYGKVSRMVPEWKSLFPMAPVNDLGTALDSDPARVMPAIEPMGQVCTHCHQVYQPKAFFKYHWGDFHAIAVSDPLSKQQASFAQLMLFLEVNFAGIETNLRQGQYENARKQFQGFRVRFNTMAETCMHCHDTERHYYIDKNIRDMIDRLDQALQANPVDVKQIEILSRGIGNESCYKCHLVHVPAAAAQRMAKAH